MGLSSTLLYAVNTQTEYEGETVEITCMCLDPSDQSPRAWRPGKTPQCYITVGLWPILCPPLNSPFLLLANTIAGFSRQEVQQSSQSRVERITSRTNRWAGATVMDLLIRGALSAPSDSDTLLYHHLIQEHVLLLEEEENLPF
jgi:hypothetical protein